MVYNAEEKYPNIKFITFKYLLFELQNTKEDLLKVQNIKKDLRNTYIIILEENIITAVLPTMGGQTALNLCKECDELGIWEKFGVRLIGVDIKAIDKAEDRELFRRWMIEMNIDVATAKTANSFGRSGDVRANFN
jgi:carbamoylphosphate synthase large subunit